MGHGEIGGPIFGWQDFGRVKLDTAGVLKQLVVLVRLFGERQTDRVILSQRSCCGVAKENMEVDTFPPLSQH